ncbi:uncharacterized protein LOC135335585 [Halichondria panicea]|uniref:uncharacterized protein LOC135335585 n=1 Tax=Halichondria panicea TaxID=6063 RepID=UPI00312B37D3
MYSCKEDPGNHDHADKKIDVNILVVPQSQWKTDLRHANLSTCTTSISAGFVRVCPDVTLVDLKDEVSQQLDSNFLPESYIFLRNVGHRLTLVGPKQESVLKVRLFLPPIAPCPEIYILNSSYLHSNQELLPPVKNVNGKKSSIENCNCNKNNYCAGHCSNPPYHHDHHLCSRTTPNLWWEERYRGTGCSFPVHNDAHSCCHNPTDYIATSEFSQPGKSTNKRFHSDTCTPASSSHDHSKPLKEGAFAKFRGTSKTYPQGNGSSQQVIDHPNGTHTSSNSRSSSDTNGLSNLGLKMHVTGSATQRSKTDNSGNLEQNDFTSTVLSQGMAIQNFHQSAPTLTNQEERCSDSKNAGPTVSKQNSKVGSSNTTKTNTTEAELSTTHNHSQSGNSHESENNQGGKQSEHCQVNSQSDPGISIERKMAEQRERKNTYPIITLNQKAEEPVGKQGIKHGQVNSPSDPAVSTERKMAEQREHKNTYPTITLNQKAEEQGGKQGIKHGQINSLSDPAFSTEKRMAEQRERKNTYPTITLNQTEAGEPVGKQGIKQGQINSPSDPAISTERKMAEQRERKNTYPTITLNQTEAGEPVGKQGIKQGQINSPSDPAISTERKMAEQRERKNTYPTITLNQKAGEQVGKQGIKHGQINSPSDPAFSTEKRMAEQRERKNTYPTITLNQTEAGEPVGKQGIKQGQINSPSDPAISTERKMAEQRERKNTYPTITLNQKAGEQVGKQGINGQINSPSDPAISTERKMAEQRERKNTYPTITLNQKAGEQVGKQGIKHGQFNSPSDPAITTERKMAEQRERKNTYPTITLNQKAEEQGGKKGIKHGQINSPSDPAVSTEKRMAEQSKDTYPTIALEHKQPEVATQQTINEPNKTNNSRQILSQEKNTNFKPKFDFKLANVPPLPPAITVTESNKIGKKDLLSLTKHKSPTGVTEQPKNKEPKVATHQTIDESNSTKNSRRIFSREKKSENTTIKPKFDTADLKLASVPPPLPAITVTEHKKIGNNIDLLFLTKYKGSTEAGSATAASESIVNKPRPSTAETNDILGEIRRMKEESEELLSLKAKLSSALRSIQIVVRTHREKHGNEWKIKYFQEKKMSTILEEKIHRTRNGNEKIKNGLDKIKAKKYTRAMQKLTHNPKVEPPSELSNVKIRCKRRKRDIERLRSKLESVKLQLSAERKIRESTVDECKTLRSELMKEKITHSRKKTKHQIAVAS